MGQGRAGMGVPSTHKRVTTYEGLGGGKLMSGANKFVFPRNQWVGPCDQMTFSHLIKLISKEIL